MSVVQVDTPPPAAVLGQVFPASILDEDSPHGLGGGGKEVTAALELLVAEQSQVGFMDQGCGLEGVVGGLVSHSNGRQFPQLVINERKKLGSCVPVAGRCGVEEPGDIGHHSKDNLGAEM
jgi:hypothetical protein